MKLDIKTIIGFVVIGVVAYLCRPMNDKIADVYIENMRNADEEDVLNISGNIEGHSYVDLGLSVKWATCNIGADNPENYGDYFAWGETEPKYSYEKYSWSSDDVANAKWGGSWRLPTKTEWDELVNKCYWEWTTLNGRNGYKITVRNGNWIFLPAAGYSYSISSYGEGSCGYYWSSTVDEEHRSPAYGLFFKPGSKFTDRNHRNKGRSVRPVTE